MPYFSWVTLVPVSIATLGLRPLGGAVVMGSFACFFWMLCLSWLQPTIASFTGTHIILSYLLFFSICLVWAIPFIIFGAFLPSILQSNRKWGVLRASIIYTICVSCMLSIVPASIIHVQYQHPLWIQHLDLGGLPLVLFMNALFQFFLVKLILIHGSFKKICYSSFVGALTVLLCIVSYGQFRITQFHNQSSQGEQLSIAVIQPNFSRLNTIDPIYLMTESVLQKTDSLDLIVWPELPVLYSLVNDKKNQTDTFKLTQTMNIPLMLTSGYVLEDPSNQGSDARYFNTSHLVRNKEITSSYNKRILVPFFEYVPYRSLLKRWFPGGLNYIAGNENSTFSLNKNINIIPSICYEVIFSSNIIDRVNNGGNILINQVSDTWFGNSAGSASHFSLALFRSIEYRIPLVRAANSGISAFVQASGEIVPNTQTKLMKETTTIATVNIPTERSFYAIWGNWFLYLITFICIADYLHRSLPFQRIKP